MTATIELPDECRDLVEAHRGRLGELLLLGIGQARIREARRRYEEGEISIGRAAELAGLTRAEVIREALARGIEPAVSEEMLDEVTR
ncbi:MAG: UPF0175 family protein [Limisphaerales bacterium]